MKLRSILFILFLLGSGDVIAQAPLKFNYQAVIRDGIGNVLPNQNIGLQISIRQYDAIGAIVYTERHNGFTTNIGLLNVAIGNGIVTVGDFSVVDWSAGPYFIEM